jgi:hypothetical protein
VKTIENAVSGRRTAHKSREDRRAGEWKIRQQIQDLAVALARGILQREPFDILPTETLGHAVPVLLASSTAYPSSVDAL